MKKLFIIISLLLVCLTNNYQALANDTALSAMGDNVGPFEGTPDVVLDHEIINLDVYQKKTFVDVTFFLKNVGETQTILVGFPDESASVEIPGQEDVLDTNIIGPINHFKTYINNVKVDSKVKYQIIDEKDYNGDPVKFKQLWHTFPVKFPAGEMTVIKNTYWVDNGYDVLGVKNFRYTIKTGKKWKGLIGSTKIYVNFNQGLNVNDINKDFTNVGMNVINPKKAMWEYKNFEPDVGAGNGYFFLMFKKDFSKDLKTRLIKPEELEGLTDWELKALRNEIFARHGRKFKTESLDIYFNSHDWYKENPNYKDSLLNNYERKNAQTILNQEKKIGSKIIFSER